MSLRLDVMSRQAHVSTHVLQHEQYLAVLARSDTEEQHHFIDSPDLRTRRITTTRPGVRFAFDENRRAFTPQIELVGFFDLKSDRNTELGLKSNPGFGKEQPSCFLELSPHVSIAYGAEPLKVILHGERSAG